MSVAKRFGRNLHAARRRAGISQEQVGLLAGLHRTEIGLLERGERTPRIDTLAKLAGALGLVPGALMEGIVWESARIAGGGFISPDAPVSEGAPNT